MGRSLGIKIGLLLVVTAAILWIGWEGAQAPMATSRSVSAPPREAASSLDLNRATADELATLPGVGEIIAKRIIRRREDSGLYGSVQQLLEVRGIGAARLARLRPLVHVSPGGATHETMGRSLGAVQKGRRGS